MQCLLFIFIKSKQSMNFSLCAPKWLDHLSQKFLRMKTLWLRTITTMGCFFYIQIVQILVHTHFDLASWLLDLEATELVSDLKR